MHTFNSRHSVKRVAAIALIGILLLTTLFASIAAGPDEPKASNVNDDWEVFEGHAYADNRAAPAGVSLVACLGGCEDGYETTPAITGEDGIYQVKVEPGQSRPAGRMVTFWLIDDTERVEADQDVLFRGQGETRVLDLNFVDTPTAALGALLQPGSNAAPTGDSTDATGSAIAAGSAADAGSTTADETETNATSSTGEVTTDLTVPSASDLGLTPSDSPQSYANTVSYGGIPLLPGFVIVLGLMLGLIGVSLLMYRRRLTWQ